MPFQTQAGLRLYTFESLDAHELPHAVVTRQGGVSQPPWASLNVGGNVGDTAENVAENRKRALASINRPLLSTHDVWQVHSSQVVVAQEPRQGPPYPQADAVVTNQPSVTLMMRFADCLPILLYDPHQHAVGMVHAGWRGTVAGVAADAVLAMRQAYGAKPEQLICCFGPAIAAHHYPVGPEVVGAIERALDGAASEVLIQHNGEVRLDLTAANEWQLRQLGVTQFEHSGACTACDTQAWYSHRAEKGETGRFAAVVSLGN